jgi:hypothetical protein
MFQRALAWSLTFLIVAATAAYPQPTPRFEFRRMVAHWTDYADPEYLKFIDDTKPEVVQVGFYGGHFWSLAHTPQYKGYPAHFPVQGLNECGDWFTDLNAKLHKRNVKVVGHFNVEFLVGEPDSKDGPRGFFKFYRDLWNEKELGPRPLKDPLDFMQRNADGTPIVAKSYSIGGMREYSACLNNPQWRKVLKAWVKVGIDRGVDGYVSNYFYRHNCLCSYCEAGFRDYLKKRFSGDELAKTFDIKDVNKHVFSEIVGWHNPKESTPLRREMLRYSQISCKEAYDDVFVKHGRSLKKDLILAQWNHLGNFNQINGDERSMLPKELWGKDEDYAWYSTGAAAVYTDFEKGDFGEGTLQARYLRGAFDNKPFTLGKYENTRMRVAIAELAANGGAPMGFYANFKNPAGRKEIVRYYQFLEKNDTLFRASRPAGEVLLLFPRSRVHDGDVAVVEAFRQRGKELLDQHVLFDVLPDDLLTPKIRESYRAVVSAVEPAKLPDGLSVIKAPTTVRASIDRTAAGDALVVHLVNYARESGAPGKGKGAQDERPHAANKVSIELVLPKDRKLGVLEFLTPEQTQRKLLEKTKTNAGIRFDVPEFLVYAAIRVELLPRD